ncbi:unnamed protein product [Ambrosiozyma monospora]|uniref:Unnamed protein product n=1 Tax=Ambrosiozyma monospora TaxID=43982 RepID=A0ACB5STX1_AMBMO|nr:unnamed protein product [Ambrosiozyma monospora]
MHNTQHGIENCYKSEHVSINQPSDGMYSNLVLFPERTTRSLMDAKFKVRTYMWTTSTCFMELPVETSTKWDRFDFDGGTFISSHAG